MPTIHQEGVHASTHEVTSVGELGSIWLKSATYLLSAIIALIVIIWNDLREDVLSSKNKIDLIDRKITEIETRVNYIEDGIKDIKGGLKDLDKDVSDIKIEIQKISVPSKSGKNR
jgi:peptidoglycan hydrolase CwlO-like protein